jgi:hypothetical protein
LFGNPTLSEDKIHLLNAVDFDWKILSSPSKNKKRSKSISGKMITRLSVSPQRRYPGRKTLVSTRAKIQSRKQKTQPNKKKALLKVKEEIDQEVYATNMCENQITNREKEDSTNTPPMTPPEPNMAFLQRSIGKASWVAQGISKIVKMFVSF